MRNFRLLNPDEIECRISQVSEKGVTVLLYKTARTDYSILDETVGMYNWQNDYRLIDGKMYCGIGIQPYGSSEWIWKWNVGIESYTEAEKGQASDAMKRAGFCWGIGTELYSAPFIFVPMSLIEKTAQGKDGKPKVFDSFTVSEISYDEKENISGLKIKNQSGSIVYEFPRSGNQTAPPQKPKAQPKAQPVQQKAVMPNDIKLDCAECHAEISDMVHDYSVKYYGLPLCRACQAKRKKK